MSSALDQVQSTLLEQQLLNLLLNGLNLRLDLRALVLSHAGSDDRPADATGTTESLLGPDEHVGHVLVLAEQRDVEENLERLAVGRQHNKLRLATVQGLGRLVGTLAKLLVVGSLLNEVEDLGALARDSPMESSIMDPVQQVNAEAELRRIFEMCDVNNTGSIDKRELIKACRKHEEVAKFFGLSTIIRQEDGTRDAMEAFFQSADTNDDREMSWDELKTLYLKQFSTAPAVDMREESTMAIEDQPLFAEDELIDEFREMPVSPRPTMTEEIDDHDEVEVDLKPPLSMTVQAGQIVPASSDGSVSITGRVSSSNTDISSPRFTAGPPPRPEAPQPKRWLGQWDDDGYSSASTPSSDLDSEISDLDTDEEIAALEKEEEAERAKLEKPRRSKQRNSSKGPAKRGQAKRTSQQRPLLATENTSNGRIAPSAPGGPRPVRQSVKKLRSSGAAPGISSDRDVPTDEDNDPRSANQLQLSARLAALSNPVRAPLNSDGKPSFVRPQHRRQGKEALMQQAKGHRVLKTAPVLAAVPEQPVRSRFQRNKGPPPGGASAIPLPQLEPKLPPRYEVQKVALGPPRRKLDIGNG